MAVMFCLSVCYCTCIASSFYSDSCYEAVCTFANINNASSRVNS